jgi:type IV secretion system protein VirB6
MSKCSTLAGSEGVAAALRVVDCVSAEATATAFGRLFGPSGAMGTALTLLLTLYVALLAINLLTGRSRLGLNMFTPRMLGLGLVLTFATSWIAYQSVVWTLLSGAPDQIASIVTGQGGSATAAFARELDRLFDAVARAAELSSQVAPPSAAGITPAPAQAAGWTATDVLWMAAMLLLLGTVGVLLVARIALAALLALGPVFIVLALFRGSHGLFVGWLKAAVTMAVVPLFTVLIGGGALALLAPVVAALDTNPIEMRPAVTMFLGAAVYVALMLMVLKVSGTMVAGWQIGRRDQASEAAAAAQPVALRGAANSTEIMEAAPAAAQVTEQKASSDRVRTIVAGTRSLGNWPEGGAYDPALPRAPGTPLEGSVWPSAAADRRVRGVGARFRAAPSPSLRKLSA